MVMSNQRVRYGLTGGLVTLLAVAVLSACSATNSGDVAGPALTGPANSAPTSATVSRATRGQTPRPRSPNPTATTANHDLPGQAPTPNDGPPGPVMLTPPSL